MKLSTIIIGFICTTTGVTSLANQQQAEVEQTRGAATGLFIGGLAGGPVGAFAGAVLGGEVFGRLVAQARENRTLRDRLAVAKADLASASLESRNRMAELNRDIDTLLEHQQKQAKSHRLPVQFRTASSVIEPQYESELSNIARTLRNNSDARVNLYGHADRRGDEEYNHKLSRQRIQTIERFLVHRGATNDQILSTAFGESQPQDNLESLEGNFFDRRVVIELNMIVDPQLATR